MRFRAMEEGEKSIDGVDLGDASGANVIRKYSLCRTDDGQQAVSRFFQ